MNTIGFKINYQVKQKQKFEKFLNRFKSEIGYELINLKIEKYYKIENQFQARFYIEARNKTEEKLVYEVLKLSNKLWSSGNLNWVFNGPHEFENIIFECILNNENDDQPLKWAHIELNHNNQNSAER
ncbi:hypothetical protein [uncultured Desulfuromonas sp.]|uniref:hypothetical protein n=1 Tax=uncultured Desulfuromonas sp. TaxID=181013 RepID=UPI002AAAC89A|nr:hypothetical protein [uncultured Desulfuromonas sp.]